MLTKRNVIFNQRTLPHSNKHLLRPRKFLHLQTENRSYVLTLRSISRLPKCVRRWPFVVDVNALNKYFCLKQTPHSQSPPRPLRKCPSNQPNGMAPKGRLGRWEANIWPTQTITAFGKSISAAFVFFIYSEDRTSTYIAWCLLSISNDGDLWHIHHHRIKHSNLRVAHSTRNG